MNEKTLKDIIQTIQQMEDFDWYSGETPPDSKRYEIFTQAISNQHYINDRNQSFSKVLFHQNFGHTFEWFKPIQLTFNELRSQIHIDDVYEFFQPMLNVFEHISNQMQPARAHRGAETAQLEPRPTRRAIEAADLPTFPPLFCTAIDLDRNSERLQGLSPSQTYHLHLRCLQSPSWQETVELHSNKLGELKFNMHDMLKPLLDTIGKPLEIIWLLEETVGDNNHSGEWTSGLVWMHEKTSEDDFEKFRRILLNPSLQETQDHAMQKLIEINLLARWERYTEAYELARKRLLSASVESGSNSVLYREALWQFISQLVSAMINRLMNTASEFQTLKPEWNAIDSLRALQESIKEWD